MTTPIPSKTDDEIKKLARDTISNQVFWDHFAPQDLTINIFLSVGLAGFGDMDIDDLAGIYEYYDQAGPRSINGYPCFFSARFINQTDMVKFLTYLKAYEEAIDNV